MIDVEKVVKGLLCIKGDYIPCASCKYANADGYGRGDRCKRQCASEAIDLLKEQEGIIKTLEDKNTKLMLLINEYLKKEREAEVVVKIDHKGRDECIEHEDCRDCPYINECDDPYLN